VGWIFEYALTDRQHRHDPDQLRALQDFFLKYDCKACPVSPKWRVLVAWCGNTRSKLIPTRLAAYN